MGRFRDLLTAAAVAVVVCAVQLSHFFSDRELGAAATVVPQREYFEHVEDMIKECRGMFQMDVEELIAIPSISALPTSARAALQQQHHIQEAARWLLGRLTYTDFQVQLLQCDAPHPLVLAEWVNAPGRPTVLIYGHYDIHEEACTVLAPGRSSWIWRLLSWLKCMHWWQWILQWYEGPFQAETRHGWMYGRGINGGKGSLLLAIQAVEALMRTNEVLSPTRNRTLPLNVKFIIEGQGELGTSALSSCLRQHQQLLSADLYLSTISAPPPPAGGQHPPPAPPSPVHPPPPSSAPSSAYPSCADPAAAAAAPGLTAQASCVSGAAAVAAVDQAWEVVTGDPALHNRDTRAVPALQELEAALGIPGAVVGWDRGENTRARYERVRPEAFDEGREVWARLLVRLGECEAPAGGEERRTGWELGMIPEGAAGVGAEAPLEQLAREGSETAVCTDDLSSSDGQQCRGAGAVAPAAGEAETHTPSAANS